MSRIRTYLHEEAGADSAGGVAIFTFTFHRGGLDGRARIPASRKTTAGPGYGARCRCDVSTNRRAAKNLMPALLTARRSGDGKCARQNRTARGCWCFMAWPTIVMG